MIKGRGVLFLDGDFRKENPKPAQHSECHDGKWFVYKYGPEYANTYEITEWDDAGLRRLQAMKLPKDDPVSPLASPGIPSVKDSP